MKEEKIGVKAKKIDDYYKKYMKNLWKLQLEKK